jgi:glutaredoxin
METDTLLASDCTLPRCPHCHTTTRADSSQMMP